MNNISGRTPIKQKKKGQTGDRNKAINAEVVKLVDTCILQIVFPTWIANLVLVKKHDRSWQMCIDYSDLNNICTKDHYPLPKIYQKFESLEGF